MRTNIIVATLAAALMFAAWADPTPLIDFKKRAYWMIFTDVKMGGRSYARLNYKDNKGYFSGNISLNKGGGIAQIISPELNTDFSKYKGIIVRVKTDKKPIIIALHNDQYGDQYHYEFKLKTETTEWESWKLPFSSFTSTYYDTPIQDHKFEAKMIKYLSFIRAYQEGKFEIGIEFVKLY